MNSSSAASAPPLRLWPGVLLIGLTWGARFGLPSEVPELLYLGVATALLSGPLLALWWVGLSRAPRAERWMVPGAALGAMALCYPLLHASLATGMQRLMYPLFAFPTVGAAVVAWAAARLRQRRDAPGPIPRDVPRVPPEQG